MGRDADPRLERRGLDDAAGPDRRSHRTTDRRGSRHRGDGRHALHQGVPGGGRRPGDAAGAPRHPLRLWQLPLRPLHGRRADSLARARARDPDRGPGGRRRGARRERRGAAADRSRLPHRSPARHGAPDASGARGRRIDGLGSGPLGGSAAHRPCRRRRRLRRRLHLQVPERGPGRTGIHLRLTRTHRPGAPRPLGLAGP